MMYRLKNDLVIVPAVYKPAAHTRELRSTTRGDLPRARRHGRDLQAYSNSFLPRTSRDWERLTPQAKTATSLGAFKAALQPLV